MTKYLVMDVDGTLTDGKIYLSDSGELFKVFDIKDGAGIHDLLPQIGITPIVITARTSEIVRIRCQELGVKYCYQGCHNKTAKIQELASAFGIMPNAQGVYEEMAYIGDDLIDLPCMSICGLVGCPADAAQEVRAIADFISKQKGGAGAVREFIEWMMLDSH